jgi:hypothetical protein
MVYAAQLHTGLGTAALTTVLFCIPTQHKSLEENRMDMRLKVIRNFVFLTNTLRVTKSRKVNWTGLLETK